MRRQLCLILEPNWLKLTTCDWIRRIPDEATNGYTDEKYSRAKICDSIILYLASNTHTRSGAQVNALRASSYL